jgi:hypothetical protein
MWILLLTHTFAILVVNFFTARAQISGGRNTVIRPAILGISK